MTETLPPARRNRGRWRRRIANLLIAGGLLALAYPGGTWGYAWWEQRVLATQLVEAHPALAMVEPAQFFVKEDMTLVAAEQRQLVKAGIEAERAREYEAFRDAALDFAATLEGQGGEALGRIFIPKIGVDVVMLEGTGKSDLREGPGHWPETPLPGMGGNFVVSGHRTTYGAPFLRLDKLEPGDEIRLLMPYAALVYTVTRTLIVLPNQTEVVAQRGVEELSFATCHPIYSARQRLVVQAELSSYRLIEPASTAGGADGGS
ncbi:MAG: class E sortase [Thermoleophilia bacterium]|nr:class E sortase [Thermoleophilia bacterium]